MSPSDGPSVRLVASATAGVDVFIIDSQFRIVAQGGRRLEKLLSPGIYKVKFQAGSAVHEEHVVLEPGAGVVEVRSPALSIQSSAPLAGTQATHEYHMASAAGLSRGVQVRDGAGAKIFVFARVWTDPNRSDPSGGFPRGQHPATGLTLHDVNGRLVADLCEDGEADLGAADPWSGCTIEVAPGPYRLRLDVPEIGVLEQMVVAPPDWQAQVFLLQGNYSVSESPVWRPDLISGSILLARAAEGFDPDSESLQLTELARVALTRHRLVVASDLVEQLLGSKFENPMLGLYAAHALLAASTPDHRAVKQVIGSLRAMIGAHPDVDALGLQLGEEVECKYELPPMLRRSWTIVVEHAARRRDLVPAGSLASRASTALWGNTAWLIWESDRMEEAAGESPDLEEGVQRMESIAARLVTPEGNLPANANLDEVEQEILSYVARRSQSRKRRTSRSVPLAQAEGADGGGAAFFSPEEPQTAADASETTSQMAEALGLASNTVQSKVGGLLRKLE